MAESSTEHEQPAGGSGRQDGARQRTTDHRMPDMDEADARNGEPEALGVHERGQRSSSSDPEHDGNG
jgi:hypothetical protein